MGSSRPFLEAYRRVYVGENRQSPLGEGRGEGRATPTTRVDSARPLNRRCGPRRALRGRPDTCRRHLVPPTANLVAFAPQPRPVSAAPGQASGQRQRCPPGPLPRRQSFHLANAYFSVTAEAENAPPRTRHSSRSRPAKNRGQFGRSLTIGCKILQELHGAFSGLDVSNPSKRNYGESHL